jgi:hypothetical protein
MEPDTVVVGVPDLEIVAVCVGVGEFVPLTVGN